MTHAYRRYTGAGNTFIVMDTAADPLSLGRDEMVLFVRRICDPTTGPGADGVILINESSLGDFRMDFYNPDGTTGMLCGNGARCAVRAAKDWGYASSDRTEFEVLGALNSAEVLTASDTIRVHFQDPVLIEEDKAVHVGADVMRCGYVDLGSQHLVIPVSQLPGGGDDIESLDVAHWGPVFRHHAEVQPKGANANFIAVREDGEEKYLRIRTFERGVEGETLACGTGCMSSAIVAYLDGRIPSLPVRLKTQSDEFVVVNFSVHSAPPIIRNLSLEGSAVRCEVGTLIFSEATGDLVVSA